jgi:hypothetical protein
MVFQSNPRRDAWGTIAGFIFQVNTTIARWLGWIDHEVMPAADQDFPKALVRNAGTGHTQWIGNDKSPSHRLAHRLGWIKAWMGIFHSKSRLSGGLDRYRQLFVIPWRLMASNL